MNLLKECVRDCNRALQTSPSYAKVEKCPAWCANSRFCCAIMLRIINGSFVIFFLVKEGMVQKRKGKCFYGKL